MTGESLRQTDTNFESEENTMKKILALLLAVAMIAAFCACAQQSADTAPAAYHGYRRRDHHRHRC